MRIMTRLLRIALAGLLVLWTVGAAAAGPAADHVHESIDAVLKILADPDLKTSAKTVERWRAVDVRIEGISLVANYRAQFNTIISRSGYPDLVSRLKAKRDVRSGGREDRPGERDRARPRRSANESDAVAMP